MMNIRTISVDLNNNAREFVFFFQIKRRRKNLTPLIATSLMSRQTSMILKTTWNNYTKILHLKLKDPV